MAYDFNSLTKQADEATNRDKFYTDFEDVDPSKLHQISELTEWMRTKAKGSDVREVIAQLFERTWVESIKEGNANMEVAQARGSFVDLNSRLSVFERLVNTKADEVDVMTLIKNLVDGSPKGTYANLSALTQAYPNGTQGVFITLDNNNWNYWNGSNWVAGGVYQGTTLSEPEKNKILDDVFVQLASGGFAAKTSNFDTAQISADNNLYIDGNVIKGNASGVTVKTTKATTAQLFVFKSQEKVTSSSELVLVDKITFSPSQAGDFYVAFPKNYGHNIVLGFSGSGLVYSNIQPHLISFLVEKDKESIKLEEIKRFNFTSSPVQFAYSVTYEDLAIDERVNAIKSYAEILDTSVPSYNREYPIVFDFVKGTLTFKGFLLNKYNHAQFYDFSNINQKIPLPALDKTKKDFQNYVLVAKGKEVVVRSALGGKIPQSKFDSSEREVISISIQYPSENVVKPNVYMMSSPNRHLVKVIINHTTTEDNNDQWDEVTAKVIDGGLYHYTYAALGDSITRGENSATGYSPMFGDRYTDFVSKTTGMIVNNYGIGGTRITYTDNQKGMVTRVHQLGSADIYSVFGGTNDFAANVPMGERGSSNMNQFKPAFEHICQTLRETGKKCFIITPIKRNNTMTPNSAGLTLKDYVDAEIEIAKDYGIPVLNLFDNFTQTAWKSEVLRAKYMPDGLHPNPAGMKFIGEAVTKFIKQQFEFD